MKKKIRINYNILEVILGKEFEEAKNICLFNGYILLNSSERPHSFYYVNYELEDNKVVKCYFKKIIE